MLGFMGIEETPQENAGRVRVNKDSLRAALQKNSGRIILDVEGYMAWSKYMDNFAFQCVKGYLLTPFPLVVVQRVARQRQITCLMCLRKSAPGSRHKIPALECLRLFAWRQKIPLQNIVWKLAVARRRMERTHLDTRVHSRGLYRLALRRLWTVEAPLHHIVVPWTAEAAVAVGEEGSMTDLPVVRPGDRDRTVATFVVLRLLLSIRRATVQAHLGSAVVLTRHSLTKHLEHPPNLIVIVTLINKWKLSLHLVAAMDRKGGTPTPLIRQMEARLVVTN